MRKPDPDSHEDAPGASALREYRRRRTSREARAQAKLGRLGVMVARALGDPQTTPAWKQGAEAEMQTAGRLASHLRGTDTVLLHDRRIPSRGRANIDHLAIGPGGVTVIDTKGARGRIQLTKVGGLLSPRREVLLVNGRDRTAALDGLERQMTDVTALLANAGFADVDVRGALCYPNIDKLPLLQRRARHGSIIIDDTRGVARLARRRGALDRGAIERVAQALARGLPQA
jgi:hypothetical protein